MTGESINPSEISDSIYNNDVVRVKVLVQEKSKIAQD